MATYDFHKWSCVSLTCQAATIISSKNFSNHFTMSTNKDKFLELRSKMYTHYFSSDKIPLHSVETCVIEAPDHGHETTSEAASFWIYFESLYGHITGDWQPLRSAWLTMEKFYIGSLPTYSDYNPTSPARYAPEGDSYEQYPVELSYSVPVGRDPIAERLKTAHGTIPYCLHWLGDPTGLYGFGPLFNTFQRGPLESCWKTIPQPCTDDLSSGGTNGFLDLFVKQTSSPAQSKFTVASDADARCIQGIFWAKYLADQSGGDGIVDDLVKSASKMGDWLAYTMFDKYFIKIGTSGSPQPAQNELDAWHGLMGWYTAYGGPLEKQGWAFRIGSSHIHTGYQNTLCAFAMARFFGEAPVLKTLWEKSLTRQIELYCWLQSNEGAIAGGVTNSWKGRYEPIPSDVKKFYGMAYTAHPVYSDPPSNQWSGMNAWGMERNIQLYYLVRDRRLGKMIRAWVAWVVKHTRISGGGVKIPMVLKWTGQPDSDWVGGNVGEVPRQNTNLRCEVIEWGQDLGIMASFARSLMFFNAIKPYPRITKLIDAILAFLTQCADEMGYAVEESRPDYVNFDAPVYVPPGWTGKMPNGDGIDEQSTFFSIRKSIFEKDPMYQEIRNQLNSNQIPKMKVHRFWAQSEILLTLGFAAIFEMNPSPLKRIKI